PSTTRLPLGNTCVTTAATLVVSASERFTEPLPSLEELASAVNNRVGRLEFRIGSCCLPRKLVTPVSSVLVRLRCVSLERLALSVMFTVTVRMSPTWCARWSLKNAREPLRHNEFGLYDAGCTSGIGICTG